MAATRRIPTWGDVAFEAWGAGELGGAESPCAMGIPSFPDRSMSRGDAEGSMLLGYDARDSATSTPEFESVRFAFETTRRPGPRGARAGVGSIGRRVETRGGSGSGLGGRLGLGLRLLDDLFLELRGHLLVL